MRIFLYKLLIVCSSACLAAPSIAQLRVEVIEQAHNVLANVLEIKYPFDELGDPVYAKRSEYFVELLKLALDKTQQAYRLKAVSLPIATGSRNIRNLNRGHYDVNWLHTSIAREQNLLPVRIPLYKGLIGWRILFIQDGAQDKFKNINASQQLKKLVGGLGHDWPDTLVMLENDFTIATAVSRESILNMLRRKRVDYFSRSVLEIWDEQQKFDMSGVAIENHIMIAYPSAFYFFMAKENTQLAKLITLGLERSIQDGSFDTVFLKYYGDSIRLAKLKERRFLRVANGLLPEKTPHTRAQLWFTLDDLDKHGIIK